MRSIYSMESIERVLLEKSLTERSMFKVQRETSQSNNLFTHNFNGFIDHGIFQTIFKATKNESLARLLDQSLKNEFTFVKGLKTSASYSLELESNSDELENANWFNIISFKVISDKALLEKHSVFNYQLNKLEVVDYISDDIDQDFQYPVSAYRISSGFNLARRHPVKRRRVQPHNGIDFSAKKGTAVYPAKEGLILEIGRSRARGIFIVIEHFNGMKSIYGHLRKVQEDLQIGDYVDLNDQIGEVGKTGFATGAHLHFGILNSDNYFVNPLLYLAPMDLSNIDDKIELEDEPLEAEKLSE